MSNKSKKQKHPTAFQLANQQAAAELEILYQVTGIGIKKRRSK